MYVTLQTKEEQNQKPKTIQQLSHLSGTDGAKRLPLDLHSFDSLS